MFSKLKNLATQLLLGVTPILLISCSFPSFSEPQEAAASTTQEFDPYTNTWKAGRAIETPVIHPPSPAPEAEPAPPQEEEGGVLKTIKKPLRWLPGID